METDWNNDKSFIAFLVETALKFIAEDRNILILGGINNFAVFDVDPKRRREWGDISTNAAFKYYSQLRFETPKELSIELAKTIGEILDLLRRTSAYAELDGTVVFSISEK